MQKQLVVSCGFLTLKHLCGLQLQRIISHAGSVTCMSVLITDNLVVVKSGLDPLYFLKFELKLYMLHRKVEKHSCHARATQYAN